MSFLKISDPNKRDSIVKEFLELKKNILDNLLSERTREQELRADLSKFFKPITEMQKATMTEIMEGLKPITEGIEAITFPPTQPLGEASSKEEEEIIGELVKKYLNRYMADEVYGIREMDGIYFIGNEHAAITDNNIMVANEVFKGTPGLWELITSKNPDDSVFMGKDLDNYKRLILITDTLHRNNNPNNPYSKRSGTPKWDNILTHLWHRRERESMRERVSLLCREILTRC